MRNIKIVEYFYTRIVEKSRIWTMRNIKVIMVYVKELEDWVGFGQ